jgi:Acyl-CoA dehydrogenase, C-terminal domain
LSVAVDVARDAIQVHGWYGLVRQLPADRRANHLESIWRDSKVGEIYEAPTRCSCGALRASHSERYHPADSRHIGPRALNSRKPLIVKRIRRADGMVAQNTDPVPFRGQRTGPSWRPVADQISAVRE